MTTTPEVTREARPETAGLGARQLDPTGVEERLGWSANGWPVAVGALLAVLAGAGLIVAGIAIASEAIVQL